MTQISLRKLNVVLGGRKSVCFERLLCLPEVYEKTNPPLKRKVLLQNILATKRKKLRFQFWHTLCACVGRID